MWMMLLLLIWCAGFPSTQATVVQELKLAIVDQYRLVEWGMGVHGAKCDRLLLELHVFMVSKYKDMGALLVSLGVLSPEEAPSVPHTLAPPDSAP